MRTGFIHKCSFLTLLLLWRVLVVAQPHLTDTTLLQMEKFSDSMQRVSGKSYSFVVGDIMVEGNKKTKPYIIERELPFKQGDSINLPDLVKAFEVARQQLMNTALFNDVVVALKSFRGYTVDIIIEVKERWYIFPIPYLKPVDRNLQEWVKQDLSLTRLNYGFKFNYNNFTGRNDKLKFWLITGYTQQIQFQYEQPYADKTLKHGYKIGFSYSYNKEVNFATLNNAQAFSDSFGGVKRWYANIDYTYRPGLRTFHGARIALAAQEVDSLVIDANPKYFLSNKRKIIYPELSYTLTYVKVDYVPYPLTGWMGDVTFLKRGINKDMDLWQLNGRIMKSWELSKKVYFLGQAQGMLRVPFNQPYVNQRMFGYSDLYLRGLEKYVIDGVAGFMLRSTLRREILRFNIPTYLKSKSHNIIPFRIYVKTFADMGYAHNPVNPENSLTNRMLYSTGFGLDAVTFYDFVIRFDYSFNQLGQNGLFLHIKSDF